MTDEEKEKYKEELLKACKMYSHIDYDDDADIIKLMLEVAVTELKDLIQDLDEYNLSSRQRLLILVTVKELYDNREKYNKDVKGLATAVYSMLLKEIYRGN